jgi:hypothetical protein
MAKKKSKHYPVVKQMPISSGGSPNTLIDGARFLSVTNRRLYRFGRYYQSKIDVRPDYAGPAIEVFVLRDDWAVQKGFQMAYQKYLDNTMDERENLASTQVARWEDFRCEAGLTLPVNQARPVLHDPAGAIIGASVLNAGEFVLSEVVDSAGTTRTFTWGDGAATKYSILGEYAKAANVNQQPQSGTTESPYENIDANTQEGAADGLMQNGNAAPYNGSTVNDATPWVRVAVLGSGTAGQQKLSSGFFTAPCGLVLLKGFGETSEAYSAAIEFKSGDYKGVHAPSMIEVATVNRKRKVVK